jgi:hypothetical protein
MEGVEGECVTSPPGTMSTSIRVKSLQHTRGLTFSVVQLRFPRDTNTHVSQPTEQDWS